MKQNKPRVSVVMATYNGEKYIREQIDSILNQSYPIYELIIQDDCSTDSTPKICREYESKFQNVHFFQNTHNQGFNDNFRTVAMRATGDFIALSDQDDIWFQKKIEKQIALIGKYDICTTEVCHGTNLKNSVPSPLSNDPRVSSHGLRCILGHSMLIKRGFAQDNSNWKGVFTYDWSLTLHADWGNGIVKVPEVLSFHRTHKDSFTIQNIKSKRRSSTLLPYLEGTKYFKEMQQLPKFKSLCEYICTNTANATDANLKLQYEIAKLMTSSSSLGYLRLCWLCMKERKNIYAPASKAKGLIGIIRGFFFPAIYADYTSRTFE